MLRYRPSILLAISALLVIALVALFHFESTEVATGCVGGIIALGMKLLEGSNGGG